MVPLLSLKARFPCIITHLNFRSKKGTDYPESWISEIVLGTDRPWEGAIMREIGLSRWEKSCDFFHFFHIRGRYHKPCYWKLTHHEDQGENVNIKTRCSTNLSHVFSPLNGCKERMSLHFITHPGANSSGWGSNWSDEECFKETAASMKTRSPEGFLFDLDRAHRQFIKSSSPELHKNNPSKVSKNWCCDTVIVSLDIIINNKKHYAHI